MRNNNYEFVQRSKKRIERILKKSDNLVELILLKRRYRNNKRNIYEIRPEIVRISLKNSTAYANNSPL
jgi:hypothetical protein